MSWKSLVTASLLCALATPAFAAPTVSATALNGSQASGFLNNDGNWVWTIRLSQSSPIVDLPDPDGGGPQPNPAPGSPLAAELGFTATGAALVSASANTTDFDDPNPGKRIFTWETLVPLGGTGDCGTGTPGLCPVGFQQSVPNNQVFAALGSVDYLGDSDGKDFATIITAGPVTPDGDTDAVSNIVMGGAYAGKGRIAELNPLWDPTDNNPAISVNYDTYGGTVTRTARGGDADLDGAILFNDFGTFQTNFNVAGTFQWYDGDFDGDGSVTFADFGQLQANFNETYTVYTDSNINAFGGGGGGVPEPASMGLVALALLGVAGLRFRR